MTDNFKDKVYSFCQSREKIGKTEELFYLEETNFRCAICGKHLYRQGLHKLNKDFQIAHIFPNSPTESDFELLDGVELYGECSESYENKIALCKDCHWDFDQNKSIDKYNNLLQKKKTLCANRNVKVAVSNIELETELIDTIYRVSSLQPKDLKQLKLSYDALKIEQKIDDEYAILRNEIENNVRLYYTTINNCLTDLCKTSNNLELAASAIRQSYLLCQKECMSKEQTFDSLCDWLASKTSCKTTIARIVISYFVQHCEVYDKLS